MAEEEPTEMPQRKMDAREVPRTADDDAATGAEASDGREPSLKGVLNEAFDPIVGSFERGVMPREIRDGRESSCGRPTGVPKLALRPALPAALMN